MKIAIDLTSLADNFSGIERHAAELSRALINIDNENEYVLVFKESVHSFFEGTGDSPRNVSSVILPRGNKGKLHFSQVTLPRELANLQSDITLFFAFPAPLLFKGKSVSTIHDLSWHDVPETMLPKSRLYWRVLDRINAKRSAFVLTISQFSKSRIVNTLNLPSKKVLVTYCGIDHDIFNVHNAQNTPLHALKKKYGLPENYILTLSTIEPRKNIGLLVEAWCRACAENCLGYDLVLAGRKGWKQEGLLRNVPENLKSRIHFTGFVENGDLPALYAGSQMFVFPSIYEGFGLPPVEAASCGACVLCSDIPCLKEICGNAVAYFKNNDVCDLKRALVDGKLFENIESEMIKDYCWESSAEIILEEVLNA